MSNHPKCWLVQLLGFDDDKYDDGVAGYYQNRQDQIAYANSCSIFRIANDLTRDIGRDVHPEKKCIVDFCIPVE